MKIVITVLVFTFVYLHCLSQPCNSANVTLINQNDLSAFLEQNGNCTEISGNVFIGMNVEHLDGLQNINKIGGYLSISNCDQLSDIAGLSGLKEVGSWMRIQNNPQLFSLNGLQNLKKVKGDFFYISANLLVKNLDGLSGLDSVNGIFQVWDMDSLTNLNNLNSLKFIGSDCNIFKNDILLNLQGIDSLTFIGGALRIYENPNLQSLQHLNPSLVIQAQLAIYQNSELEICNADPVCEKLILHPETVYITENNGDCANKELAIAHCTSSTDQNIDQPFIIYPNPATDFITTQSNEPITIYSLVSHKKSVFYPQASILDISSLPSGLYILSVKAKKFKLLKL